MDRVLVFTRTKHGANRVVKELTRAEISSQAIHGNKSQSARERALAQFKNGETRVLVATDIAARGLDVEGISHVVNFDLPEVAESYVHRIGRTARAGAGGSAYSFCDADEQPLLRSIERLIRLRVRVVEEHPHAERHPQVVEPERSARGTRQRSRKAAPAADKGNGRSRTKPVEKRQQPPRQELRQDAPPRGERRRRRRSRGPSGSQGRAG
jgi:ATP-dependent RNA helicase RhlE